MLFNYLTASEGQPGWNPRADVNKDGIVGIEDLAIIARAILE
ncbi:hypothetical protein [Paenibacillus sp. GCM10027629]